MNRMCSLSMTDVDWRKEKKNFGKEKWQRTTFPNVNNQSSSYFESSTL